MQSLDNESELDINNGYIAVKFSAEWCAPCKRMEPLIHKMEKEFPTIKFVSVDIDTVPELAQKNQVRSLPCIVLFNKGQEVNRISGSCLTEPLRKAFRDLTNL